MRASVLRESLHLLGNGHSLFAVVSHPNGQRRSRTGAIILNSGQAYHIGDNRVSVVLARHLAEAGFVTTRIDQSGKGESPARSGVSRTGSLLLDFDEVARELSTYGIERFVIIGNCSGADDGLIIADQRQEVSGLVLIDGFAPHSWIHRLYQLARRQTEAKRLLRLPQRIVRRIKYSGGEVDVRDWDAPNVMIKYYRDFLQRNGKLFAIFTSDTGYYTGLGQLTRALGASSGLTEIYMKGASHAYDAFPDRKKLYEVIGGWMERSFAPCQ